MSAIPASAIVSANPGVLAAGGTGLALSGLLLTNNDQVPTGTVVSFANADDVSAYFGPSSDEYELAVKYFLGYNNSLVKPGAMLFAQYPEADAGAYLRGGSQAGTSLAELQAISGTLAVVIDGYTFTVPSLNLFSSTSFSSAAGIIQSALIAVAPAAASVTASVGGVVTASVGAIFTATGTGTSFVVTSVTGVIHVGCTVTGTGVPASTTIIAQVSGTPGGAGTYTTSGATTAAAASITAASNILDVTAVSSGSIQPTDVISGTNVTVGTVVILQLSGATGGVGTYALTETFCAASTTVTSLSTVMKVTAVGSGTLQVNSPISGTNIVSNSTITGFLTGTGGVGTYTISDATTAASTTITSNTPSPSVTYDTVSNGFVIASGSTGVTSTIGFATGTTSASLKLTEATGAVLSQGAAAGTPSAIMNAVVAQTQNFASFMTAFEPDTDTKLLFSEWTNGKNNRYLYAGWDTDAAPAGGSAPSSFGAQVIAADYSGTAPLYNTRDLAAELMGFVASVDFTSPNARATMAFRAQTGTLPTVTSQTVADNLALNGYNWYGAYATANDEFTFLYPGTVSGPFTWLDTYINQIWLNNELQLALMVLLTSASSIPYNAAGYALIAAACQGPINAGLNFGAIRPGVTLSASQIAQINAAAGADAGNTVSQRGWYLAVRPASPEVRAARGSPPITLFYADGGSVQQINLSSIVVQ